MEIFLEVAFIIGATVIIAGIARTLKQPLIIGYIFAGILLGPYFLQVVQSTEILNIFSRLGIAFLLFIVGLNLNPKIIKDVGKVSLITGVGQVIFTSVIGFAVCRLLGFPLVSAIYIAVALTFSSTIIIMKLLSDKGDLESLYGRIAIGFLIVQDLIVVLILMVISATAGDGGAVDVVVSSLLKGGGLIIALGLIGFYILPKFTRLVARSQEFLLLFSIGWCLVVASLFGYLDFSFEIGALLAGMTLSISPLRHEITSRMKTLRDFFIVLFFILLGSQIIFAAVVDSLNLILILSAFILIGNPLIVMVLMGILGYTRRTSFLAGLTVAQISEFSIILVALGVNLGHLGEDVLSTVTVIGLITITASTYLILYANPIYRLLSPYLKIFERKGKKIEENEKKDQSPSEIILFGCHRMGSNLLDSVEKTDKGFLVVDHDPLVIDALEKEKVRAIYGDAEDIDFLENLNFDSTKMIISTIPNLETNVLLSKFLRKKHPGIIFIATSYELDEAIELYDLGAAYVITPYFLGGHYTSRLIEQYGLNEQRFTLEGQKHKSYLQKKKIKNSFGVHSI